MKTDKVKIRELQGLVESQKKWIAELERQLKAMTRAHELCRERFNGFVEAAQLLAPAFVTARAAKGEEVRGG